MQRLYAYVDESGQDTGGRYFIVAVILADQQAVSDLEEQLARIERETGKSRRHGVRKWTDTRGKEKVAYLTRLLSLSQLEHGVFYASFTNTTNYTALTTQTIAQAIAEKATTAYRVHIMIDGLNAKERGRVSRGLHERGIKRRKLIGGRDESSALLRLADAMAGFLRDYEEGQPYAHDLYHRFVGQHIMTKLLQ
jgi:hypothetical protein